MKKNIILIAIVLFAAVLRFYQLGSNPPSLTWDEVAWGYNAYAIGIDGKDEFGRFLPVSYLESFGDYKPPVYAYLDVIPIKIFGLNEFATRFPSAFFGTMSVFMTYFLVKRLFRTGEKKTFHHQHFIPAKAGIQHTRSPIRACTRPDRVSGMALSYNRNEVVALLSAFILAISPWHSMLSRAAFEANVADFFLIFGVYAFLRGIQDKSYFLVLSAISFVITIYTFNTERVVSPLLVIILSLFSLKKLWQMKAIAITAAITGLLLLLPVIPFLLSPQAKIRFQEVNIFSNVSLVKVSNQEISNAHEAWWAKILDNRRVIYGREFLKHYFDNLSLNFLFIHGDGNPKFSTQDVGEMYIWELPFLILGAFFLFRYCEGRWYIIPLWLLIGIIPAATARETPHALRIETTLPTFQILVAYGLVTSWLLLKRYKTIFIGTTSAAMVICLIYFLHGYYAHYPAEFSGEWQYGYKDSIAYVQSVQDNYDHIVMTNGLGRPYIYYLFYLKIPPQEFRQTAVIHRDTFGFVDVEGFSKYLFPTGIQPVPGKTLYILQPGDKVPTGTKLLKTFYLLNGKPSLEAYGTT